MEKFIAKVVKIDLDLYFLNTQNSKDTLIGKLRGNTKKKGSVLVGDMVSVEKVNEDYMITAVLPRKNSMIRPRVANVDQMIIVVSILEPDTDYILLDKQIVLCESIGIKPIVCVNKIDLAKNSDKAKEDIKYIRKVYSNLGIDVLFTSTVADAGIEDLRKLLIGKTSAFSGNSGVGKSSITNKLVDLDKDVEVGVIGRKSKRGKHTTKSVNLYAVDNNSYILDTPGFSSYELYDIEYRKLKDYYDDFRDTHCDYDDCMHVIESEDVCDVKRKVNSGAIDLGRYERYVYIYNKLKDQYDRRYK